MKTVSVLASFVLGLTTAVPAVGQSASPKLDLSTLIVSDARGKAIGRYVNNGQAFAVMLFDRLPVAIALTSTGSVDMTVAQPNIFFERLDCAGPPWILDAMLTGVIPSATTRGSGGEVLLYTAAVDSVSSLQSHLSLFRNGQCENVGGVERGRLAERVINLTVRFPEPYRLK